MSLLMAEADKALIACNKRIMELERRIHELEAERNQFVLRLANMQFVWEKLRDSPQATPDIRAVAVGFVGEKV